MEIEESAIFKKFQYLLLIIAGFLIVISTSIFYEIIVNYLSMVREFFQYFEKTKELQTFLNAQISTPNLTVITLLAAILFSFLYLLAKIRDEKIMIWKSEDIHAKYFHTFFIVLSLFNYILLIPLIWFLWISGGRLFEIGLVISFYIISMVIVSLFQQYGTLLKNFKLLQQFRETVIKYRNKRFFYLSDGKTTLFYFVNNLQYFLKMIIVLMFLSIIISLILSFNLLTFVYIEMVFLFWYFIISSIGFIPTGTVNIFFNSGMILNDVFIIEDSQEGYLIALDYLDHKKKIMKSSVKFIEPASYEEQV